MKKKSEKNPVGRPPVEGEPRAVYMHLRVTQQEKDRWQQKADRVNLSLSQWVREALDNAAKR